MARAVKCKNVEPFSFVRKCLFLRFFLQVYEI